MVFVNYEAWQSNTSLQVSGAKYRAHKQEIWIVFNVITYSVIMYEIRIFSYGLSAS